MPGVTTALAVTDGVVGVQSDDLAASPIYGIDATWGRKRWGITGAAQSQEYRVQVGGDSWLFALRETGPGQPDIAALSAVNGQVQWTSTAPYSPNLSPVPPYWLIGSGLLYVPCISDSGPVTSAVIALDPATGQRVWTASWRQQVLRGLAVYGGTVYVGMNVPEQLTGQVVALDAATGARRWLTSSPGFWPGQLVATGGALIASPGPASPAGGSSAKLLTLFLDAATGSQLRSIAVPVNQTMAVADGRLFLGGDQVGAVSMLTGGVVWETATAAVTLAVAGGVVYAADRNARLHALAAANGKELWSYPATGSIGQIITTGDAVFVTSGSDQASAVYALQA